MLVVVVAVPTYRITAQRDSTHLSVVGVETSTHERLGPLRPLRRQRSAITHVGVGAANGA